MLSLISSHTCRQAACYFCPVVGCEGSNGFKYVRIHVPGAAEQATVGLTFTCSVCGSKLREEKSYRKLSGKIHVCCLHSCYGNCDIIDN